jgi:hypothetical protein
VTDDPDDPNYRYPEPGERLWHWRREQWVVVIPAYGPPERAADERGLRVLGEVAVTIEATKERAIAKLTNLEVSPENL